MSDHNRTASEHIEAARVRRVVLQVILLAAAAIATVWLLYALRSVLLLLAFTIIFCYLVTPLVDFVERPFRFGRKELRAPHTLAIFIVYLLLFGGCALAVERILPLLSAQFASLFENVPGYLRQLDQQVKWLATLPSRFRLPSSLRQSIDNGVNAIIPSVVGWAQLIATRTVQATFYLPWLVLIPVIGFFFLKDGKAISNKLLTSFPQADMRYRVAIFLKDVSETLAAYIRTQLLACLIVGVIEGAGLWLLGIPYSLVFAVLAGVFEFVPVVGPAILAMIVTLVAGFYSWRTALLVAGFLALFRIVHDYVIYPRLLSKGMEIHPVAVILAVLCGAELGGVTGVFLSVPVVALSIVCWKHWRDLQIDRSSVLISANEKPLIESVISQD